MGGFVYPNENLGKLSPGLGGSEVELAPVVAVTVGGLKAEVGFVVLGAGAGLFSAWGPNLAASDGMLVVDAVSCGCLGCSTGLGAGKSEGPDPVLPTLGKANVGFVAPVVVVGDGWLVGKENVGAGVAVGLEVVVVCGAGGVGLLKKLGTVVLVAVVEGSGFVIGAGVVVAPGLAKKFGTADCAGAGTVVEGVGAAVGLANKFFTGSLFSVVAVSVVGFGCVGTAEVGVNKLGVVALVTEVVVVSLGGIVRAGEGFFSSAPFWS